MLLKLWGIMPADTLNLSMGEINQLLEAGVEKYEEDSKIELYRHADILTAIFTAGGVTKQNGKPFEVNDFIPPGLRIKQGKTPVSKKEMASLWSKAGNECVKQFEQYK